jgi:hypothetical protein
MRLLQSIANIARIKHPLELEPNAELTHPAAWQRAIPVFRGRHAPMNQAWPRLS